MDQSAGQKCGRNQFGKCGSNVCAQHNLFARFCLCACSCSQVCKLKYNCSWSAGRILGLAWICCYNCTSRLPVRTPAQNALPHLHILPVRFDSSHGRDTRLMEIENLLSAEYFT